MNALEFFPLEGFSVMFSIYHKIEKQFRHFKQLYGFEVIKYSIMPLELMFPLEFIGILVNESRTLDRPHAARRNLKPKFQ